MRAAFERHLGVCPNCCVYLATYRAIIQLGRAAFTVVNADARDEVPEDLVNAILILVLADLVGAVLHLVFETTLWQSR